MREEHWVAADCLGVGRSSSRYQEYGSADFVATMSTRHPTLDSTVEWVTRQRSKRFRARGGCVAWWSNKGSWWSVRDPSWSDRDDLDIQSEWVVVVVVAQKRSHHVVSCCCDDTPPKELEC